MCKWYVVNQVNRDGAKLADKHYSRQKPGTKQFLPPGRKLVLITDNGKAVWGTSWPFAEYVHRDYKNAWICTIFRNESSFLSSDLIREAVAVTRWKYVTPPDEGIITLVNAKRVKSVNPGYCYKVAGFKHVGYTKAGLHILQMLPCDMPDAILPANVLF